MTEPYDYDENNTDDGNDDGSEGGYGRVPRAKIRAWEAAEKQAKKDATELANTRRELALTRAGLGDLSPARQKALLANIDGDITADAARAAAEELGFITAAPDTSNEEEQALNRMSQASAGATDPSSEDSVARLERAAREGGKDALLAQIRSDGALLG